MSRSIAERRARGRRSAGRSRRRAARAARAGARSAAAPSRCSSAGSATLEAVLVLRPADAVVDGQVLHRLHEERRCPAPRRARGCRRRMIVAGARASRSSSGFRLIWMRPLFGGRVGAVDADERRQALDRGILQDRPRASACWRSAIAANETVCGRLGDAEDHAGVLHREEALRHDDVEHDRRRQRRRRRRQQRRRLVPQHPAQRRRRSASITPSKSRSDARAEPALLAPRARAAAGARTSSA